MPTAWTRHDSALGAPWTPASLLALIQREFRAFGLPMNSFGHCSLIFVWARNSRQSMKPDVTNIIEQDIQPISKQSSRPVRGKRTNAEKAPQSRKRAL